MYLSQVTEGVCKKLLNLRTFYHFWKPLFQILHLLGVADLMRGDEFEPCVEIEPAHERMLPTIDAQVALFRLGEKGEGAFTCFSKLSELFFFVADHSGFQRGWRFQA